MRRLTIALPAVLVAALVAPAAAHAGGWASVSLAPRAPQTAQPGHVWQVDLTVLQHGATPLEGVRPAVVLTGPEGEARRFAARPTGRPGVYRARVEFAGPGTYTYAVDDGFTNVFPVEYPAVRIAAGAAAATAPAARRPAPAPADPGFPWALYGIAVGVLAAAGAGAALALRGRPPHAGVSPGR